MPVPRSDNAGPGSDIFWPELMSEGKETLLVKKKANRTMLGSNFILSISFISEKSTRIFINKHPVAITYYAIF